MTGTVEPYLKTLPRMVSNPTSFRRNPSSCHIRRHRPLPAADFSKWDSSRPPSSSSPIPTSLPCTSAAAQSLSPLARYIHDALRHGWTSSAITALCKLRRVPPSLVSEVLNVQSDPNLSSRFFHWAGKQPGFRHTFSSYNALARCLSRSGRHCAADQVIELMASNGRPPSQKQFELLIKSHAEANRGLHVYHLFDKMRLKFKIIPDVPFYTRIMEFLVRTGQLELAMSVHRSFQEDGLKEEPLTFMVLAKGLCKSGRVDEALELLGKMKAELCKPDVFAYTAMMKLMSSSEGCRKLWSAMAEDNVPPDAMAYALMVSKLCKGGDSEEALALFREMREKGLVVEREVYGDLVEALVRERKLGIAEDLVRKMVGDGYRADERIYAALVVGNCAEGRREKAWTLLRAAVNDGYSHMTDAVHSLLRAFAVEPEKVALMVKSLAGAGILVVPILEEFFLAAIEDGDRATEILDLFLQLKSLGFVSATMGSYVIRCLGKGKKPEKAIEVFSAMEELSEEAYSAVIPSFIATSKLVAACDVYSKMRENSMAPDVEAYEALARGLCRKGEVSAAVGIVGDCLANAIGVPREFYYAAAVLKASRKGMGEVVELLEEMVEEGIQAGEVVCAAVIHGFCGGGEGKEVLRRMEERGMITEEEAVLYGEMLTEEGRKRAAGVVVAGLKFFGLEGRLRMMREGGRERERVEGREIERENLGGRKE